MKAWKAIGLAALAIGLTPFRIEKNEEEKTSIYESLLCLVTVKRRTKKEGEGTDSPQVDVNLRLVPRLTCPEEYEDDKLSDRIERGVEDLFGDDAEPVLNLAHEAAGKVGDVVEKAKDAVEDMVDTEAVKEAAGKLGDAAFDAVNHAANKVKGVLDGE